MGFRGALLSNRPMEKVVAQLVHCSRLNDWGASFVDDTHVQQFPVKGLSVDWAATRYEDTRIKLHPNQISGRMVD